MLSPFHFRSSNSRDGIRTSLTLRHLLPSEGDDTDAWRSKAKARLRKLLKRRVDGISGRQVYVADMMLKSKLINRKDGMVTWTQQRVMETHGKHWQRLTREEQAAYDRRAQQKRNVARQTVAEEIDQLHTEIQATVTDVDEPRAGGMQLRSCKLSEEQWSNIETLYTSEVFTRSSVADLRAAAVKCPDPVSIEDLEAMSEASPLDCHLQLSYCELAKQVAQLHKAFKMAIFAIRRDQTWTYYCLLQTMRQPLLMMWLPLDVCEDETVPTPVAEAQWGKQQGVVLRAHFKFAIGAFSFEDVLADVLEQDVFYSTGARFHSEQLLHVAGNLECLSQALSGLSLLDHPAKKARTATKRAKPSSDAANDAWKVALAAMGSTSSSSAAASTHTVDQATVTDADDGDIDEAEEENLDIMWETLEQARQAMDTKAEVIGDCFRESLLGGSWQQVRTGRLVYGYQSVIKKGTAVHDMARHFHLSLSAAFESNVYGESGVLLSQLWRERMFHLTESWLAAGRPVRDVQLSFNESSKSNDFSYSESEPTKWHVFIANIRWQSTQLVLFPRCVSLIPRPADQN
eukprot:4428527-Amphidinium_carterae.2